MLDRVNQQGRQGTRRVATRGSTSGGSVEPLEGRRLLSGTPVPVGPEFQVNEQTAGDQLTFMSRNIATDAEGNFVIAWESRNTGSTATNGVYARRFGADGTPLEGDVQLTDGGGRVPAVAMNAGGSYVTVFEKSTVSGRKTINEIRGRRYDAATRSSVDFVIPTPGSYPKVAMADDGSFTVVWSREDRKGDSNVYAQRFDPAGVKVSTEFRVNDYLPNQQAMPCISMDGQGNFLVAWSSVEQNGAANLSDVYAKRYSASGLAQGPESRVNEGLEGPQSRPITALLPGGGFAVAWDEYSYPSFTTGDIRLRLHDGTGWASGDLLVNSTTAGHQSNPSVDADDAGNVIVTWHSIDQDGTDGNMYGQQFDPSGRPAGSEFRLNDFTNGDQVYGAVAAQPGGRFVAVWESEGQDGSGYGVHARLFAPPPAAEGTFSNSAIDTTSGEEEETPVTADVLV